MAGTDLDQTLVLIKPDALKLSMTGYILSQFSETHTGLRFAGMKIVHVHRMLAEEHYAEHRGKVFYPPLLDYIMGLAHYPDEPHKRRVIALVYRGPDAVQKIRDMVGPTNPHVAREKRPGCIRSLGTIVPVKEFFKASGLISTSVCSWFLSSMFGLLSAAAISHPAARRQRISCLRAFRDWLRRPC